MRMLEGKSVAMTGGGGGLGLCYGMAMAEAGASVAVSDINLAAEQATELAQRDQISRIWNDNVAILRSEKKVNDWEKSKAAGEMLRVLTQVSPAVLSGTFADLMKSQPEAALKIVGGLSRKIQNESQAAAAQSGPCCTSRAS